MAAAPGIASGPAHVQVLREFDYPLRGESPAVGASDCSRHSRAVRDDINGVIRAARAKAIREIFITHLEMLDDPELGDEVEQCLRQGESAEAAWMAVIDGAARQQEALHDALLAERAADLHVGRRVLAQLCGEADVALPDAPYVLVMEEVGPSDVARLDPARVAGILTARGALPRTAPLLPVRLAFLRWWGQASSVVDCPRHAVAARRPARTFACGARACAVAALPGRA